MDDIPDGATGLSNAFAIGSRSNETKNIVVFAATATDKYEWLAAIMQAIQALKAKMQTLQTSQQIHQEVQQQNKQTTPTHNRHQHTHGATDHIMCVSHQQSRERI